MKPLFLKPQTDTRPDWVYIKKRQISRLLQ